MAKQPDPKKPAHDGMEKRGGVGKTPSTPRPNITPHGQNPPSKGKQ